MKPQQKKQTDNNKSKNIHELWDDCFCWLVNEFLKVKTITKSKCIEEANDNCTWSYWELNKEQQS